MSDRLREAQQYLYVPARSFEKPGCKLPTCKWVNGADVPDGIDPRTIDNPHVLPYGETEPDQPHIIVGLRDGHMLDIDVDVGEDHDVTYDGELEDIDVPDGALAFRSASGGLHIICKFERDHGGLTGVPGVDIQGDMEYGLGVVTSPFHHPEYELTDVPTERVFFDDVVEHEEATLNKGFGADLLEPEPEPEPEQPDRLYRPQAPALDDDYTPTATGSGETTDEIRDVYAAIDRIDAQRVAEQTIVHSWNDEAGTSDGNRSFYPTWGPDCNGTANIVNGQIWQDTGSGGYGGPVVMALIELGELRPTRASPGRAQGALWWRGVERLRELGYSIPEFDESQAEPRVPTVTLPIPEQLTAGQQSGKIGWAGALQPTGIETGQTELPKEDVHHKTEQTIATIMDNGGQAVVDGMMGTGKTYSTIKTALDRAEPLTYLCPRRDLMEQAKQTAIELGLERDRIKILPSSPRHCPTHSGSHGEAWQDRFEDLYDRGVSPKTIHTAFGPELPCIDGEDIHSCPYMAQWQADPDQYDLIIGHFNHAHLPRISRGRHVCFDETVSGDFTTQLAGERLTAAVNGWLALEESPPFDNWHDLIRGRADPDRRADGLAWFEEQSDRLERDEQTAIDDTAGSIHTNTPLAVYTILTAEPIGTDGTGGFERTRMPNPDGGAPITGLWFPSDETNGTVYTELLVPPELDKAKSILALDGTPYRDPETGEPSEWSLALGRPLEHRPVLTGSERETFLTETLGNTYIQGSAYVKPYSSGEYANPGEDQLKLTAYRDDYFDGNRPVVITAKAVADRYGELGLVENGTVKEFNWHGNLRGSNEYADCRSGVVLGSTHHGDHELQRRAAMLGQAVSGTGKGIDRTYGEHGDQILRQMREAAVGQAALRFGRDGLGARVVIETAAIPDWLPVANPDPADIPTVTGFSPTQQLIREAWPDIPQVARRHGVETKHVNQAVARHTTDPPHDDSIRRALDQLAVAGHLELKDHPSDGRKRLVSDTGLERLGETEPVERKLPELVDEASLPPGLAGSAGIDSSRMDVYTWAVDSSGATAGDSTGRGQPALTDGGHPPPNPPGDPPDTG